MGLNRKEVDRNMKPIQIGVSILFILLGLTDLGSSAGLIMFVSGAVLGLITFITYK